MVICTDKVTDEIQQLVRRLSQYTPQVIVGFRENEAVILIQEELLRVYAEGGQGIRGDVERTIPDAAAAV